ncbi:MAG TPA: hypothetical protein VM096_17125 [Vicinamibacterales bacterium]|nr:hypothetical protein [Vicinamibacterales bacterium]
MVTRSRRRFALIALFFAGFVTFSAAGASAQSAINFTGGASIDPTQVYAGVSWESPDIGGRFRIRPGIDGGFGDGIRLGTINLDLIAKFPLGTSGWTLVQGGGPTIIVAKYSGELSELPRELHAGGSYLFGFQHDNGFFADFRVGGGNFVPQLKLGVGWSVQIK